MSSRRVKFIVTKDQIYMGTESAPYEIHRDIAEKYKISREDVLGGGDLNLDLKIIFGRSVSGEFGPFDKQLVQRLLPDFDVVDEAF